MNKLAMIAAVVSLPGITACSDGNSGLQPFAEATVRLEGSIGQATRGVIGSGYEEDLEVVFVRQDESFAGSYGAWGVYKAVRQGGAGNRPIVFSEPQWYPSDGRTVRLHGVYPAVAEDAVDTETGKVIFTVDGMTDIMATGLLGATGYTPVRTCTFRHLLTQVRPVCYSDRPDEWGAIVRIEVPDVHTRQELDCGKETPRLEDVSSGGDIRSVDVLDIAGLPIPGVEEGGELPEPRGYVLLPVSPANGTEEHPLHFRITTTKDGRGNPSQTVSDVAVSVEGGFQPGRNHVISLFFTGTGTVLIPSVHVEAWTEKEQGNIPI